GAAAAIRDIARSLDSRGARPARPADRAAPAGPVRIRGLMRVAHFSKSAFGGAGRAMVALSEALRAEGADSFVVTLDAAAGHAARVQLEAGTPATAPALASHALRENFTTRTSMSNTLFSFDYPGFT